MNRLKELRQEKKLSQKAIADIFDITEKTVSRWENGESQIKPDKAQKLADHFKVSVGYLLGYGDNPKQYNDEKVVVIDDDIIAFSPTRFEENQAKKLKIDFVRFLLDKSLFLTNQEIISVIGLLYNLSANHGETLKSQKFQEVFLDPEHKDYKKIKEEYSFIFGSTYARTDLEQELHDYISEETRTKAKSEKLLEVLKSAYGERNYLDL